MSSRRIYPALVPNYATFTVPPHVSLTSNLVAHTTSDEIIQEQNLTSQIRDGFKRNTGLLLITASQACFAFMNVAVKKLNSLDPPVSTMQLIAVRMGITYFCCLPYMLVNGIQDPFLGPKNMRPLLFLRGCSGFIGLFGIYFSLQYLSLSDATVLTFLAPICTVFTGALFLGETFSRRQVLAGTASLIGVILIARPASLFGDLELHHHPGNELIAVDHFLKKVTPTKRLIAVGMALLGVVGSTGAYTTLRAIGKRAHPLHSMSYFSAVCVLVSTTSMVVTKTPFVVPTRTEWLMLFTLIGIFGFFAQVFLTMGFQRETAGRGTMAVYTQIVFASILERIFLHTIPTPLSIIGTTIILFSALCVAVMKEGKLKEVVKLERDPLLPARDADVEGHGRV